MALTCNIDAKGKRARLINGIVMVVLSITVAVFWARPTGLKLIWIIAGVLLLSGAFAIFEARAGWCVIRAMGFKTKI